MPQERGLIRRILLKLDEASTRKAAQQIESMLDKAGEAGGKDFFKSLQKQYNAAITDLRLKLGKGLIDSKQFRQLEADAKRAFNDRLIPALERARSEAVINEREFAALSRRIKSVGDVGAQSAGLLSSAFGKAFAFIGGTYVFTKIADFIWGTVQAAAKAEDTWNNLATTVESAGVRFKDVEPELRAAADQFERVTRFDDEQFASILQKLVAITGDYRKSIDNVITVVGVSVKYHVDLERAATMVGKAINGVSSGLERYGIKVADGAAALALFRSDAQKFAEEDARTLGGRLDQLTVAWDNLKKAIGGAIAGGDDARKSVGGVTDALRDMTAFVEDNRSTWDLLARGFAGFARGALFVAAGYLPRKRTLAPDLLGVGLPEGMPEPPPPPEPPPQRWADDIFRGRAKPAPAPFVNPVIPNLTPHVVAGMQAAIPQIRAIQPDFAEQFAAQQKAITDLRDYYREGYRDIEGTISNAAMGAANAWKDAFGIMFKEGATVGKFFEALGRGMVGSLLGGLAEYASTRIARSIAEYFDDMAMAASLAASTFAGNFSGPVGAAAYTASAHAHLAAIPKWAILAGMAGAGQAAIGGGGSGGTSGGIPSGASDIGGRIASNTQPAGPEIHIYIDPLDPFNPAYQKSVYAAEQYARERYGEDARITVQPRSAA